MTDTTKFKSVGLDIESYEKLQKIIKHQRRNIRQQLGLMIDQEFKKEEYNDYRAKVTSLGLGAINSLHTRD
jgi:macrodomain Ter protein organizer (MatP/YcbG family)|tara:strand:- start:9844 stop:10056 length:213 start_codon:yes stop_codon:yes gene_type:complete